MLISLKVPKSQWLLFIIICLPFCSHSQATNNIHAIIVALDSLRSKLPIEKLYLNTDKPYYTIRDTLWFKAHVLNADYLTGSTRSGIMYLELVNDSNLVTKRVMVPLKTFAFIEITTRGGHGPFIQHLPGRFLYKPMPALLPKQFYSPKYAVKDNKNIGIDLRSTIYCQSYVITDENGEATVSFYSADKAGSYTIITEGSDMNGGIGFQRQSVKIVVK
jgi:hypothetical protein